MDNLKTLFFITKVKAEAVEEKQLLMNIQIKKKDMLRIMVA